MPSSPAAFRKCFQLLVLIGVITAMSGLLVITREVLVRQLFGRDYISAEKYQSLLQELENISRAVMSVESQAVTLSHDLELLKRSARHILTINQTAGSFVPSSAVVGDMSLPIRRTPP